MSPLPFRILALPFLLWVLVLRLGLVATHAGAPFLERVGYVSLDLAFAAGCLLVAGVLYHELRWVRQLAASAWLGLVLLAYGTTASRNMRVAPSPKQWQKTSIPSASASAITLSSTSAGMIGSP